MYHLICPVLDISMHLLIHIPKFVAVLVLYTLHSSSTKYGSNQSVPSCYLPQYVQQDAAAGVDLEPKIIFFQLGGFWPFL